MLKHVDEITKKNQVYVAMKEGDVVLVDNYRTMHGRNIFEVSFLLPRSLPVPPFSCTSPVSPCPLLPFALPHLRLLKDTPSALAHP